ncbi:MAG: hypothetical protein M3O91_03225 [Chloroflexota bacterium]|nr:hypothetical protein [Chloroflexota bacterium]
MILRILEEGQFEVPAEAIGELNRLDDALVQAVESGDDQRFHRALAALLQRVREVAKPVPDDHLGPSELVLPPADATLAQVSELLGEEGLIPGR